MMSNRAVVMIVLSCLLLATGCSDDATRERAYVAEASAIEKELIQGVTSRVDGKAQDPAAGIQQLETYRARFAKLDPPSDWEDEHKQVLQGFTELQVALSSLKTALAAKDSSAVRVALISANDASDEIAAALDAMRRDSQR